MSNQEVRISVDVDSSKAEKTLVELIQEVEKVDGAFVKSFKKTTVGGQTFYTTKIGLDSKQFEQSVKDIKTALEKFAGTVSATVVEFKKLGTVRDADNKELSKKLKLAESKLKEFQKQVRVLEQENAREQARKSKAEYDEMLRIQKAEQAKSLKVSKDYWDARIRLISSAQYLTKSIETQMAGTIAATSIRQDEQKRKFAERFAAAPQGATGDTVEMSFSAMKRRWDATKASVVSLKDKLSEMAKPLYAIQTIWQSIQGSVLTVYRTVETVAKVQDTYNKQIALTKAIVLGMQKDTSNWGDASEKAGKYAESSVQGFRRLAAEGSLLATSEQAAILNRELLKNGIAIDFNNKKSVEYLTAMANAVSTFTMGAQNQNEQFRQEMNALLNLQAGRGRELSNFLKAKLGPEWKRIIDDWKKAGIYEEQMTKLFRGFTAENLKLNYLYEVQKNRLAGIRDEIIRVSTGDVFKGFVTGIDRINNYLFENSQQMADYVASFATTTVGIFKVFGGAIGYVWAGVSSFLTLMTTTYTTFVNSLKGTVGGLFYFLADMLLRSKERALSFKTELYKLTGGISDAERREIDKDSRELTRQRLLFNAERIEFLAKLDADTYKNAQRRADTFKINTDILMASFKAQLSGLQDLNKVILGEIQAGKPFPQSSTQTPALPGAPGEKQKAAKSPQDKLQDSIKQTISLLKSEYGLSDAVIKRLTFGKNLDVQQKTLADYRAGLRKLGVEFGWTSEQIRKFAEVGGVPKEQVKILQDYNKEVERLKKYQEQLDELKLSLIDVGATEEQIAEAMAKSNSDEDRIKALKGLLSELKKLKSYNDMLKESFVSAMSAMAGAYNSLIDEWIAGGLRWEDFQQSMLQASADAVRAYIAKVTSEILAFYAVLAGLKLLSFIPGMQQISAVLSEAFVQSFSGGAYREMPRFASGTDYVKYDQVAQIHKGEMIVPAKETAFLHSGKVALVSANSKGNNDAIMVLGNQINRLADRPMNVVLDFGSSQMRVLAKQMDSANYTRGLYKI
jgi:hypothetical protein